MPFSSCKTRKMGRKNMLAEKKKRLCFRIFFMNSDFAKKKEEKLHERMERNCRDYARYMDEKRKKRFF